MKKILSLVLIFILLTSMFTIFAQAEDIVEEPASEELSEPVVVPQHRVTI